MNEGSFKAEVIDKKELMHQHYYAIAFKATILKPKLLHAPEDSSNSEPLREPVDALRGPRRPCWQCRAHEVGRIFPSWFQD